VWEGEEENEWAGSRVRVEESIRLGRSARNTILN
jgi:hypothetical protein